jgi:large subunit ribosomal protein L10
MDKSEKNEMISQIKELINNSSAIYVVDYNGVNVEDINQLRKEFRKEGVTYKVFKNTLFKKALIDVKGYEKLSDLLVGMSGFAFTNDNTTVPAKVIKKYFDNSGKFVLKGCYIETQFFDGNQLDALSILPTKPEIIAGIMGSLNSPVSGIIGTINAVMRDIVGVLDAIGKKKAA